MRCVILPLILTVALTVAISWSKLCLVEAQRRQGVSATIQPNNPFVTVWNVPSERCLVKYGIDLDLSSFDIIANRDESFIGGEVVIFYKSKFGLWPRYTSDGEAVNGGLPQLANLSAHIDQARADIIHFIPNASFSGLAVIDWEVWRPVFKRNGYDSSQRIYIKKSEKIVRQEHPTWSKEKVTDEARRQFENAARLFMSTTLNLGRQMRPAGHWGFYGFPDCYNHKEGQATCTNTTKHLNDQISWLFGQSSALVPSIYLKSQSSSLQDRYDKVHGTLEEALRVRRLYNEDTIPILPYTLYRYAEGGDMFSVGDLNNTIRQSLDAGMAGVVFWDSSHDFKGQSDCLELKSYIDTTLGPFVKEVTSFARTCSSQLCGDHGRCIKRTWNMSDSIHMETKVQTLLFEPVSVSLYLLDMIGEILKVMLSYLTSKETKYSGGIDEFNNYRCMCFPYWKGPHCEQ